MKAKLLRYYSSIVYNFTFLHNYDQQIYYRFTCYFELRIVDEFVRVELNLIQNVE